MPRWNRTPGGQENQVYIRLSRQRAGRALTVVDQPLLATDVQYFGPYLGGVRARQAVAALGRIRPAAVLAQDPDRHGPRAPLTRTKPGGHPLRW
jgi:hypothetical protein